MPYLILKEYRMPDDYPILHSVFVVKTRMMCLSILSTWPSLRLTVISPGLVHDTCIRESHTSLPLNLGRTYFKFLPSQKLTTRLLNQGPAAAIQLLMKNSFPRCHGFWYWGLFNFWLHRAQIIHHFQSRVMSTIRKWFISLSHLVHHYAMLLSFESSPRIIHPFLWLVALHKFIQINIYI